MQDTLNLKGQLKVELISETGEIKEEHNFKNLVTTAGKGAIIDRLQSATNSPDYIGVGSNATAATVGDTSLGSELGRVQGSMSQPAATTHRVVSTFGAGTATGTITEYGLLDNSSGGNLWTRVVTGSIAKGASDSLQVTYDLSVS